MRLIEVAILWQLGDTGTWTTEYYEFPGEFGEPWPRQEEVEEAVRKSLGNDTDNFVGACCCAEVEDEEEIRLIMGLDDEEMEEYAS